jgi:ApeA N-terminal domain 1
LPIVYGHTKRHKQIYLLDAVERNRSIDLFGGMHETLLLSSWVLTTDTNHDASSAMMIRLRSSLVGLEEWLGISGLRIATSTDGEELDVHFKLPERLSFKGIDVNVELTFGSTGPRRRRPQTEISIVQFAYLDIVPHRPLPLRELMRFQQQAADLVSLAMGVPATSTGFSGQLAIPSAEEFMPWVDIWVREFGGKKSEPPHPT